MCERAFSKLEKTPKKQNLALLDDPRLFPLKKRRFTNVGRTGAADLGAVTLALALALLGS
jgi:hypothetical protein